MTVGADLVAVFFREIRVMPGWLAHHGGGLAGEGVGGIGVNRHAIAVHLPVRRYRDFLPRRVIEAGGLETHRSCGGIADMVEFPVSIEHQAPRGFQTAFGFRVRLGGERHRGGPRLLLVDAENRGVFPLGRLRGYRSGDHHGGQLDGFHHGMWVWRNSASMVKWQSSPASAPVFGKVGHGIRHRFSAYFTRALQ